jgi:hypothetical protein
MVKVISITGAGRSGSRILDNILGGVAGAFSAGEVRYLWQRGLVEGRLCGCSKPLPRCELWPGILDRAFPRGIDPHDIAKQMRRVRTRYTPAARLGFLHPWYNRKLAPLAAVLDQLYPAITAGTGARFIVDSSKLPTYTYLLSILSSVDLRIVHLVRDPRAVAHSRGRRKEQLDTAVARAMTQSGPGRSALDWVVFNATIRSMFADAAGGYLLLRYEDLITNPEASVRRILEMADEGAATTPHLQGNKVELGPNHTVSGNPGRFQTGTIDLALDEAWRRDMSARQRRLIERITSPVRRSFGYD